MTTGQRPPATRKHITARWQSSRRVFQELLLGKSIFGVWTQFLAITAALEVKAIRCSFYAQNSFDSAQT
ncbi:hypothetical protein BaRGS_00024711 [Batillaria attramentaria]|uniref:Uncharacterized protein n=1 Tax=Batillaria attramentaria TaxID=370345 RepID=A0ABD0KAI6_9CAEN